MRAMASKEVARRRQRRVGVTFGSRGGGSDHRTGSDDLPTAVRPSGAHHLPGGGRRLRFAPKGPGATVPSPCTSVWSTDSDPAPGGQRTAPLHPRNQRRSRHRGRARGRAVRSAMAP